MSDRVLFFDIETTSLLPARGRVLSCAFLWEDEDVPFSVGIDCPDKELDSLLAIQWRLETAPVIAGYSSIRFDTNFINKRLDAYGYAPFNQPNHRDVQKMYNRLYNGGRDVKISLEKVAEKLGLRDDEVFKTPYDSAIWQDAANGDEASMKYVLDHGGSDVILTKRAYNAMKGSI